MPSGSPNCKDNKNDRQKQLYAQICKKRRKNTRFSRITKFRVKNKNHQNRIRVHQKHMYAFIVFQILIP